MRHIIYKVTNKINGKYYIGRHSTKNINDNYMGSGIGIKNAIKKHGIENFTKELIAEAKSSEELWELERNYVNEDVVRDENSYNMSVGGKHYLQGLTLDQLKKHQSNAGKKGAKAYLNELRNSDKIKEWHALGGRKAMTLRGEKYNYKIITNTGEVLFLNGNQFKNLCFERGWNYNTLAWKICNGPKTIRRGQLKGFYIERVVI